MSKEGARATLFHNCRVLRCEKLVRDELWVKGDKIVSASEGRSGAYDRVDCKNRILAPGFIDFQLNGAYGVDFTTTKDMDHCVRHCSKHLPQTGTTAYCPTIITSEPQEYRQRLPLVKYKPGNGQLGATVLGIHVEGPFISMKKRGCHPPHLVQELRDSEDPMKQVYDTYGPDLTNVVMLTLAPEYKGAIKAISGLSKLGIVVSMGHSESDHTTGEAGLLAGASCLTHLFSAMNAFGHREPSLPGLICSKSAVGEKSMKLLSQIQAHRGQSPDGPVVRVSIPSECIDNCSAPVESSPKSCWTPKMSSFGLERKFSNNSVGSNFCPSLHYGLIADCIHTHPYSLRIAYRLNRHGLCLVTDAMSALGLPDGEYNLGETQVVVGGSPRRALKKGTDTLAGVVATMDECIRLFAKVTNCGLPYALTAASTHPAECLGISSIKGHLGIGADADFVMLDDDVTIYQTWIAGEVAYDRHAKMETPVNLDTDCRVHGFPNTPQAVL